MLRIGTALILAALVTCSCSKKTKESKEELTIATEENKEDLSPRSTYEVQRTWDTVSYEKLVTQLPPFDFTQDMSSKSLEELRLLKSTIPARHGYLFMDADLRTYFEQTKWYRPIMEARWYGDCERSGLKKAPPIEYTDQEKEFLEKLRKHEDQKLSENYIKRNGKLYANVKNLVNNWQYESLPDAFRAKLDQNGFVVVPNTHTQLFHVYEESDYSQTQNFVTTDLYLQLFHMHYSFLLRGLEEHDFVPILKELLRGVMSETNSLKGKSVTAPSVDAVQYASAFYSIPLKLLGDNVKSIPSQFSNAATSELTNIEAFADKPSSLIPAYATVYFPYSIFKPRGHYTRTDTLKMYFKAMQWLQTASYCLEEDADLRRALTAAFILKSGKSKSGKSLLTLYRSILDPTTFLVGEPDNISLLDLCNLINKRNISSIEELLKDGTISSVRDDLNKILTAKNKIKPKVELNCPGKINFMPSRFVLDNEVIQEMSDPKGRPFPQGLDVMASFGNQAAEDILTKELREDKKWDEFLPNLNRMKAKYKNYENWDASVYSKWIKGLNSLLQPDDRYPSFMQLPSWEKKNLNTALASWAELKHDAILYAERPGAAECGGGEDCPPPPDPFVVGYVEPNVNYWKEALELISMTETVLKKYNLLNEDLESQQRQLKEMCAFLLHISEKEIRKENLTEQEYRTIELIGSDIESITLNIFGTSSMESVSGPDKEVAVVADVYNNNYGDKKGLLHVAVGYVNDIYVMVEINGYLYLTKGATFSYYELIRGLGDPMTDETWQEQLKQGKNFPVPIWMNDLILPLKKPLKKKIEEHAYTSGC